MVDGFSWSPFGVVDLAKQDSDLKALIGIAYYVPMTFTHATVSSILSNSSEEGGSLTLGNRYEKARDWAPLVLCAAHNLALQTAKWQLRHFPELQETCGALAQQCVDDFGPSWRTDETGEK